MNFEIQNAGRFKKDLKLLKKRSEKNFYLLGDFIEYLQIVGFVGIDKKYKPHQLKGEYNDCNECHVLPDLLLIWRESQSTIELIRTGTHSDIF